VRRVSRGLRIGFEAIAAGSGLEEGSGGAGGYFHGIIPPLAADPRVEELVLLVPSWYERAEEWASLPKVRLVRCNVPKLRPLRVAFEQIAIPLLARRHRVDVLFSPSNFRPLAYRGANVMGLHAIQHFLLNDDIGSVRSKYLRYTVRRSVETADRTITVTDTLKEDTLKLFDVAPDRLVTVSMGPQPWVAELLAARDRADAEPYRLPDGRPYVLCISRLYALKNHARLIAAWARFVADTDAPHQLVIVGGDADVTRAELEAIAREEGVADRVVFLGRVPQADVPGLYAGATAIAYVSLYETFGHPVLEAFATDTPLLTSSRGATAEVAGGAAVLADPEDVGSIAEGLAAVVLDEELRARLVADGRRRVESFSWDSCAEETVDVLAAVAAERGVAA
jgi:glycosyltransferase involved in cell wall biosynthesis